MRAAIHRRWRSIVPTVRQYTAAALARNGLSTQ